MSLASISDEEVRDLDKTGLVDRDFRLGQRWRNLEKRSRTYTFEGPGDQVAMDDTDPKTFVTTIPEPAKEARIGDWLDYEIEVSIDNANAGPDITVAIERDGVEIDSRVIAAAAAGDGVVFRGSGKFVDAATFRHYPGQGVTVAAGVAANHVGGVGVDVVIELTGNDAEWTVIATSDAGHADNLATLQQGRVTLRRAA